MNFLHLGPILLGLIGAIIEIVIAVFVVIRAVRALILRLQRLGISSIMRAVEKASVDTSRLAVAVERLEVMRPTLLQPGIRALFLATLTRELQRNAPKSSPP